MLSKDNGYYPYFLHLGQSFLSWGCSAHLSIGPPVNSQSAPPSPSLLFPFSSIPFFFFSSFSFLNINLEWGKPFCFQSSFQVVFSFSCVRPILSFSFGCSSAKSLYLCGILRFFQWQQSAGAPVFFFRIFSDFFLSFLPKMIAEKEPKRYLRCSQRTMELSQPKGNDRKKWYKKREAWTGSKSPYKIPYIF